MFKSLNECAPIQPRQIVQTNANRYKDPPEDAEDSDDDVEEEHEIGHVVVRPPEKRNGRNLVYET